MRHAALFVPVLEKNSKRYTNALYRAIKLTVYRINSGSRNSGVVGKNSGAFRTTIKDH